MEANICTASGKLKAEDSCFKLIKASNAMHWENPLEDKRKVGAYWAETDHLLFFASLKETNMHQHPPKSA